jgi:hypothetical protein
MRWVKKNHTTAKETNVVAVIQIFDSEACYRLKAMEI